MSNKTHSSNHDEMMAEHHHNHEMMDMEHENHEMHNMDNMHAILIWWGVGKVK